MTKSISPDQYVSKAGFLARLPPFFLGAARASMLGVCFCVPITTAGTNIFLGFAILFWLFSGRVKAAFETIKREPVCTFAILLFLLLLVGAAYSPAPWTDQTEALSKFRKLLYIPIAAALMGDMKWWRWSLYALAVASTITVTISFVLHFNLLEAAVQARLGIGGTRAALKQHISHNWFAALAALFFLAMAASVPSRTARAGLYLLTALAVVDVLALVKGRTGQVGLFVVLLVFSFLKYRWRGLLAAGVTAGIGVVGLLSTQNAFSERMKLAMEEARTYYANPESELTSVGVRLAFYENGLKLIADKPLFGHGLGSTATVYEPLTRDLKGNAGQGTANPHNEYINLGIQGGVGATLLFLLLLSALAHRSAKMHDPERAVGVGLVALMSVSCLFNSSLWDFSEGVAFSVLAGMLVAQRSGRGFLNTAESG